MSAPDNIGGDKSAKITHVKTTTIDGIKVAPVSVQGGGGSSGVQQTQQTQQTTAAFRAIASSGQSTQVRVVMPPGTVMSQFKQIEGAGRTQITAIPARTVSNTSITVTRPVTQTTYIPRAGVTSTSMQGQRLVAPIRAQGTPVAGLSGNFVRGTTVTRNTSSPATTVISPATSTWMANNGNQVQLIRAINHPSRQRLITASGVSGGGNAGGVVSVSSQSAQGNQQAGSQTTLQTGPNQQGQQTFVATLATVIPRQQAATLVYTNVSNSQAQQYNPTVNTTQRFAIAPLANTQRQIRPIPMNKSFPATKLGVGMNATSISIRTPNLPLLNTTLNTANASGSGGAGSAGGIVTGVTTGGAAMQSRSTSGNTNISTTRIIQLQQQPGATTQQIIGPTGRIANNVVPIIVNTNGGGKIGIRPPTTMATKVQPSLTITQVGIGKLPPNAQQQTSSSASIQCASVSTASAGNTNSVTSAAVCVASNLSQPSQQQQQTVTVNSQSPITQIVNVSQNMGAAAAGQLLTAQNVSSAAATVVPLAITSRGNNVLTGTITPIKSVGLTVGKMMTQQSSVNQHQSQSSVQSGQVAEMIASGQQHHPQAQPTSVFIHHTRPHSGGNASGVGATGGTSAAISSTGTSFLAPGSTFYYESVPASSVTVSTGVLSLTTTTVTSSTMSNNQIVTSSNLAAGLVTSLPFNTPPSATFTVVPSSNRAIGQLQIPVSSTSTQIQAVPVRFSGQLPPDQTITTSAIQSNQPTHHQIIIPNQAAAVAAQQSQQNQQSQGHMVIPLPSSIKVTSGNNVVSALSSSAFLRKRDNDGSPIRAAKNLGPTLLSMSSASSSASMSSQQMSSGPPTVDNKKEQRPVSPASSDGSTTVSANSSPGVDQQINEEMTPVNRMPNESHFNPINDMYPNHQNSTSASSREHGGQQSNQSHLNGAIDCPPRKKSRRSTNDSQQSTQSHASSLPSLNPPTSNSSSQASQANGTANSNLVVTAGAGVSGIGMGIGIGNSTEPQKMNNNNQNINSNKENTKPTEFVIRKPRSCTLLNSYKQNWKAANNHFQRHSDVKPREERRPTVMDLANQANVLGKINGWKVHHLKSQMEDLCESEGKGYDKLTEMLNQMESHGKNPDIERISDLIKGNMQRSKIIVDGITEAQNQIMKIFDHKSHISDIIHRCASKRNFKKREKV